MNVLSLNNVRKTFGSGARRVQVLDDVSLTVQAGECVTLLGPSGSGKSTLLNIGGLIEPASSGQIKYRKQSMENLSVSERTQVRREQIGFVFQQFNLVPVMSVFDNVAYPLVLLNYGHSQIHARVMEVLDALELSSFARSRPEQLSGGQCQRVAVARALVKKPGLLIADEPTASLDAATAMRVVEQMQALAHHQNTACLIATHDARLMPYSDRVLQVEDGGIMEVSKSANMAFAPVQQEVTL